MCAECREVEVAAPAARQRGAITAVQLRALGMDAKAIARQLEREPEAVVARVARLLSAA